MLPPIRPRPIIPSCISYSLSSVDPRDAAAALLERRVVARGLRADQPAEAERLAGDRELLARVVDDLEEEPGVGPALVQLARRVEVARAVAVRDDAAGRLARARGEPRAPRLGRGRRLDERLDADVVALAAPARRARRPSPPARARRRRRASTSFVLSFAACTFGWSNGLMPRIEPATAVANSQRKNSWPSSYGDRDAHLLRLAVGPVGRLARRRDEALALLAGRLGDELLGPEAEAVPGSGDADLVAALLPAVARAEAELEARVALARRHASAISLRAVEQPREVDAHQRRGHHARTARAPSSGRRSSARRRRPRGTRARARAARAREPGSVIATHCAPVAARLPRSSRCASASRASRPTSTRRRTACARGRASPRAARIASGCVVSSTWKRSPPNVWRSTSGASVEPPIPSRTTRRSRPSTSSASVQHPVDVLAHPRAARRASRATAPRPRPSRRSGRAPRSARRARALIVKRAASCAALRADPVDQLGERVRRTSATPSTSSVCDDVVVVDAGVARARRAAARASSTPSSTVSPRTSP